MRRVCHLFWASLTLWSLAYPAFGQQLSAGERIPQGELLKRLVQIVVENNPTLISQAAAVARNGAVAEPRSPSAITGLNVSAGIVDYYYSRTDYGYAPTASIGMNIAIGDPNRALNILRVTQEKEQAKQLWEKTRSDLIAKLFGSINQMLRLKSQVSSLTDLKRSLDGYSTLVEGQVKQGIVEPDRLIALKERLANLNVELQDAKNQLVTIRLETAVSLGGKAWEEMHRLLDELEEFP